MISIKGQWCRLDGGSTQETLLHTNHAVLCPQNRVFSSKGKARTMSTTAKRAKDEDDLHDEEEEDEEEEEEVNQCVSLCVNMVA